MHKFSANVRLGNGRGNWKLRESPRWVRTCAGRPSIACPSKCTLPCSFCSVPQMQLTSVLLPDPLARLHLEIDAVERDEAAEAFAQVLHLQQRGHFFLRACRRSCTSPTMPLGAMITKAMSRTPTSNTLTADEMVTVVTCCSVPSRIVPITGPIQFVVPPISGMAIELTAYSSPNADAGAR